MFTSPRLTDHGTVISRTRGANNENSFESVSAPKTKNDPLEGLTSTAHETANSVIE